MFLYCVADCRLPIVDSFLTVSRVSSFCFFCESLRFGCGRALRLCFFAELLPAVISSNPLHFFSFSAFSLVWDRIEQRMPPKRKTASCKKFGTGNGDCEGAVCSTCPNGPACRAHCTQIGTMNGAENKYAPTRKSIEKPQTSRSLLAGRQTTGRIGWIGTKGIDFSTSISSSLCNSFNGCQFVDCMLL